MTDHVLPGKLMLRLSRDIVNYLKTNPQWLKANIKRDNGCFKFSTRQLLDIVLAMKLSEYTDEELQYIFNKLLRHEWRGNPMSTFLTVLYSVFEEEGFTVIRRWKGRILVCREGSGGEGFKNPQPANLPG